jgi:putative CocE/NonD family hydrolase
MRSAASKYSQFASGLKYLAVVGCLLWIEPAALAQQFNFDPVVTTDQTALAKQMPELARAVSSVYHDDDRRKYLDNLFRLQMVAGEYHEAMGSIRELRALQANSDGPEARALDVQHEMFALAKLRQADGKSFDENFGAVFREVMGRFDNRTSAEAARSLAGTLFFARRNLQFALDQQKSKSSIALPDALSLIRAFQVEQTFRNIVPLTPSLIDEDDSRRYFVEKDVRVMTPDQASICAVVVRPKTSSGRLPTAMKFTIYADRSDNLADARRAASYGYAGVVGLTRGKGCGTAEPTPYEYDGADADEVIDWVSKQPWSDGQVGMYGGSYEGFTQWAATKHLPKALKTIVPYVANNPGDGLPMENNVFLFVNYAWAFYTTDNRYLDNETYFDPRRGSLNQRWYESGKSYRQIDSVDGTPNKWLQRWLQHPSYDKYWQDMLPYQREFAKINIPVLTITGYYDDGQQSALRFLREHYKNDPNADHYLLIGPYDHIGSQAAHKDDVLRGYAIDPVAQINTPAITFQWLDYVLRHGKKPELLKDKINYEVMGANEWKHAPSLDRTSNEALTLYLTHNKSGDKYELSEEKPAKLAFLDEEVNFADRKTSNFNYYPFPIVGKKQDYATGYAFISKPFDEPLEISGTFSGEIKAVINKQDMDIGVLLYEVMPDGQLFHLSYFLGRASYAGDMSVRRLLTLGKLESIPFNKTRMVSRRLSKGSRLLVLINVNKNAFAQINYGTGKDVSDEDISDASVPLKVKWRNDSYVTIPIWRRR